MNSIRALRTVLVLASLGLAASSALADIVETKNGAHLVGKVTKIDSGNVYLATDYAGDLTIKQSEVTSITTDAPIVVRLASGTVIEGSLATEGGDLKLSGKDGQLTTKVDKVAASWPVGQEDPLVVSLRRHWKYEASVDITGKSGNSSQQGTAGAFRATLKAPQDTLQLYTAYDRQVTDGNKSADQFKAGIDYANNFSGKSSWYVRDEGGFDRIKDIDLYNTAALGGGYDFVKEAKHLVTGRLGVAYRYEDYGTPGHANLSTMGLDTGLNFEWEFTNSKFVDRMTYVPSFDDFANYRFTNEAFYEIPMANPMWKLRFGVSNDYTSKPTPGLKSMDTIYFTRLVLDWE